MHAGMSEFVAEQMKGLTEMVTELRRSRVAAARKAFATLADHIATVGIAQLFRPTTPIGWDSQLPPATQPPQVGTAGAGRFL